MNFGAEVTVSATGQLILIGAIGDPSSSTGIDGDVADTSLSNAGGAFLYRPEGTRWANARYFKASNTASADFFGIVTMTPSASVVAIGAPHEDSASTTNQADNSLLDPGAVYSFDRE